VEVLVYSKKKFCYASEKGSTTLKKNITKNAGGVLIKVGWWILTH
jgi:hypothetical protein